MEFALRRDIARLANGEDQAHARSSGTPPRAEVCEGEPQAAQVGDAGAEGGVDSTLGALTPDGAGDIAQGAFGRGDRNAVDGRAVMRRKEARLVQGGEDRRAAGTAPGRGRLTSIVLSPNPGILQSHAAATWDATAPSPASSTAAITR